MTVTDKDHHLNGGAAVVDALDRNGVTHVFGIPGTHNLEIYRHLGASRIHHVAPRHEQGAGYAADGYARVSRRPGVVLTTSGPGLTNAITAAATAYADSVPLLIISPGISTGLVGKDIGWLHEMKDQSAALGSVVEKSVRVESAAEIGPIIDSIFHGWTRNRPRPVHIEIPLDVLEGPWSPTRTAERTLFQIPLGTHDMTAAAVLLSQATTPAILAGGGSVAASGQLTRLAELLQAPVVTSLNGKGTLDEHHPLSLGASLRLRAAQAFLAASDVLLIVGSEVGDSDLWGGSIAEPGSVIRIDIDALQVQKNVPATLSVAGDAARILEDLISCVEQIEHTGTTDGTARAEIVRGAIRAEAALDADPWAAIQEAVSGVLPASSIIAGDSSQISYFGTAHTFLAASPNQFLYPTGFATLGFGLPAAIGAKIAKPDTPVLVLVGDGAFQFSAMELVTAVELRLSLPIVIVNNHGYKEIKDQQKQRGIEPIAVDFTGPNFAALAEACGAHGRTVTDLDDLATEVTDAFGRDLPTVIEYSFSPTSIHPKS